MKQFVVGVQFGELRAMSRGLTVGGGMDDELDQLLARPLGIVDEVMRQPVHQGRMGGRFPAYPEILYGAHKPVAKKMNPYLIYCHAWGDGIG